MGIVDGMKAAGGALSLDEKANLSNFFAGVGVYWNSAMIVKNTFDADGNFIDTDPVTGEHSIGHKTETFLSSTARGVPTLANGLLTLKYGTSYTNPANSEILSWGRSLFSSGSTSAAETGASTIAADSSVATTVAGDTALTVGGEGIVTTASTTAAPGVFATSSIAGDTALTVGSEGILTTATTTGSGVFATGSTATATTVAADTTLTVGGESIVTGATSTGSGLFATGGTVATASTDAALTVGGESIVTGTSTVGSSVFAGGTAATVESGTALTLGTTETVASTGLVATEGAVATTAAETTLAVGGGEVAATGGATVLGTVASSVILPVAVGVACYYTGKEAKEAVDIINDTRDTYKYVDSCFTPGKRAAKFQKPTPDIGNYKNIVPALAEVGKYMKNENMGTPVERLPDGRIKDQHQIDWSDPKNRAELVRAINQKIAEDEAAIKANSSWRPRWLRTDDGVLKQEYAKMDEHSLQSAKTDLANFGAESDAYIAAKKQFDRQNAPVQQASAAPATQPARTPAAPRVG